MSFKVRFLEPDDTPNPPCCDDCSRDAPQCWLGCRELVEFEEKRQRAISEFEEKTGWPEKEIEKQSNH